MIDRIERVDPQLHAYVFGALQFQRASYPSLSNGLDADGLPIGGQFVGRPFDEVGLLKIGRTAERIAPGMRRPF